MLKLLLPLFQSVPVPPPAPPAPPAPPSMTIATPVIVPGYKREVERFTVDVEVHADGELLWSGALRVAGGGATSFSRETSEPPAQPCEPAYSGGREQNSLSVRLLPTYLAAPTTVTLNVRWSRPSATGPVCGARGGTRTIELTQNVVPVVGKWLEVTGDGGLVVRLRRR